MPGTPKPGNTGRVVGGLQLAEQHPVLPPPVQPANSQGPQPGLGTLNASALTTEALRYRSLRCQGLVLGSWPADPDLAMRCNITDFPDVTDSMDHTMPSLPAAQERRTASPRNPG